MRVGFVRLDQNKKQEKYFSELKSITKEGRQLDLRDGLNLNYKEDCYLG